jgi:hypothetical protein
MFEGEDILEADGDILLSAKGFPSKKYGNTRAQKLSHPVFEHYMSQTDQLTALYKDRNT